MTGPEDAAYAALVPLLEATWPGIAVERSQQLGRINWVSLLASGALAPPLVAVALGPSRPEAWGLDNQVFRLEATLTFVVSLSDANAAIAGGSDVTAYLLQQLGAVRGALVAYAGGAFQLAGELPMVDASVGSETNRILLKLLAGLQAGDLRVGLLVGSGPG